MIILGIIIIVVMTFHNVLLILRYSPSKKNQVGILIIVKVNVHSTFQQGYFSISLNIFYTEDFFTKQHK